MTRPEGERTLTMSGSRAVRNQILSILGVLQSIA